jgi:PAS domain S-box-containing protein
MEICILEFDGYHAADRALELAIMRSSRNAPWLRQFAIMRRPQVGRISIHSASSHGEGRGTSLRGEHCPEAGETGSEAALPSRAPISRVCEVITAAKVEPSVERSVIQLQRDVFQLAELDELLGANSSMLLSIADERACDAMEAIFAGQAARTYRQKLLEDVDDNLRHLLEWSSPTLTERVERRRRAPTSPSRADVCPTSTSVARRLQNACSMRSTPYASIGRRRKSRWIMRTQWLVSFGTTLAARRVAQSLRRLTHGVVGLSGLAPRHQRWVGKIAWVGLGAAPGAALILLLGPARAPRRSSVSLPSPRVSREQPWLLSESRTRYPTARSSNREKHRAAASPRSSASGTMEDASEPSTADSARCLTVFEGSRSAIFTFDAAGTCLDVDAKGARLLGLHPTDIIGRSIVDMVVGADIRCCLDVLARALARDVVAGQLRLRRGDGSTFWGEAAAHLDSDGQVRAYVRDMRELGEEDASLLQRLERVEALSAAAFDGIGISQSGKVVEANEQLAALLGYEHRELIGKDVASFVAPESREPVARAMRSAHAEPYDHLAMRKNGSLFTVEARGKVIVYRGREARVTALRDVSEHRRLVEALRSMVQGTVVVGEEFFSALVRGVVKVLGVRYALIGELVENTDQPPGRRAPTHMRSVALWGHERLLDPIEYPLANTLTERVLAEGTCFHAASVRECFPDDPLLARFSAEALLGVPLIHAEGGAMGVLLTWHDGPIEHIDLARAILTLSAGRAAAELGRRRSESALIRSEASLRATIDATPHVAIQWYGADGRALLWNKASEHIFGWSAEEALGKTLDQLMLDPEECAGFIRRFDETIRTSEPTRPTEYSFRRRDGTEGRCLSTLFRISDSEEQPRVACMDVDITEWRRAERQRLELEGQLRHGQQLETLGTLAGGIAHDFNNILTAIFAYSELAVIEADDPDKVREHLTTLNGAAARARDLVRQILSFSRRHVQAHRPIRLQGVVREALHFVRSIVPSTIAIDSSLDDEAPTVLASAIQMQQVVLNLCMNAAQAMREGPGVMRVVLGSSPIDVANDHAEPELGSGCYVFLEVSDTGHGIDAETLKHIFEPFFTTKVGQDGTGLGLAVVQGIVRDHRGTIRVASEPGRGASFRVYLPAASADQAPHEERTASLVSSEGERVLVVDDESTLCLAYASVLERLGYRVTSHSDPRVALDAFSRTPFEFDVVVTDLTMPHIKGTDLACRMLAIRPDLPILLVTGLAEGIAPKELGDLGLRGFLSKPFLPAALAEAVRLALRSVA